MPLRRVPAMLRRAALLGAATGCAGLASVALGGEEAACAQTAVELPGLTRAGEAQALNGAFLVPPKPARPMATLLYLGAGENGYVREDFEVAWDEGEEVRYGASFLLPGDFTCAVQGEVALMRWDNFARFGERADAGGVVIRPLDARARVVRARYEGFEQGVVAPFELPRGRWFRLEVRQAISGGRAARTDVYLDGNRIASSGRPNAFGRRIVRMRFGIVAIAAGTQHRPLGILMRDLEVGPG